jgi:hypothetical protein
MPETQAPATDAPAQSANGRGPVPPDADPDTGEKWLGILVLAAGAFLLFVGIDRLTNGKLTGALQGGGDGDG